MASFFKAFSFSSFHYPMITETHSKCPFTACLLIFTIYKHWHSFTKNLSLLSKGNLHCLYMKRDDEIWFSMEFCCFALLGAKNALIFFLEPLQFPKHSANAHVVLPPAALGVSCIVANQNE